MRIESDPSRSAIFGDLIEAYAKISGGDRQAYSAFSAAAHRSPDRRGVSGGAADAARADVAAGRAEVNTSL
jgi:hypothetical protein